MHIDDNNFDRERDKDNLSLILKHNTDHNTFNGRDVA